MKVAVGSKNPIKIEATRKAFESVFPGEMIECVGFDVKSGVSNQPMSDEESIKGARNRAILAQELGNADFGVGLEGGLQKISGEWFDCGWMVIVDRDGKEGIGSTVKMHTPPKLMDLVEKGIELGIANDMIFKTKNSKQNEGHFGLMTNGLITRKSGYRDGIIATLISFIHPELYTE